MDEMLAEIEKACAEATPGPWGYTYDGSSDWSIGQADDPQEKTVATVHDRTDERARRDAPFIANSRQWVPALVAEVRRLRSRLAQPMVIRNGVPEPLFPEMEGARALARAAVLEEAARKVDEICGGPALTDAQRILRMTGEGLAAAIRGLKEKP